MTYDENISSVFLEMVSVFQVLNRGSWIKPMFWPEELCRHQAAAQSGWAIPLCFPLVKWITIQHDSTDLRVGFIEARVKHTDFDPITCENTHQPEYRKDMKRWTKWQDASQRPWNQQPFALTLLEATGLRPLAQSFFWPMWLMPVLCWAARFLERHGQLRKLTTCWFNRWVSCPDVSECQERQNLSALWSSEGSDVQRCFLWTNIMNMLKYVHVNVAFAGEAHTVSVKFSAEVELFWRWLPLTLTKKSVIILLCMVWYWNDRFTVGNDMEILCDGTLEICFVHLHPSCLASLAQPLEKITKTATAQEHQLEQTCQRSPSTRGIPPLNMYV